MWCEELCRPRNQKRRMFCVNNRENVRKVTVQPLKTEILSWFRAVSILNRPTLSCMFSKTILRRLRRSWRFGQYNSDCWPIRSRLYGIPSSIIIIPILLILYIHKYTTFMWISVCVCVLTTCLSVSPFCPLHPVN